MVRYDHWQAILKFVPAAPPFLQVTVGMGCEKGGYVPVLSLCDVYIMFRRQAIRKFGRKHVLELFKEILNFDGDIGGVGGFVGDFSHMRQVHHCAFARESLHG